MPEKEEKVTVTLKGAGMTFESEISPVTAANIVKLCVTAGQENQGLATSPLGGEPLMDGERFSLGEYVHKYEPTTYPEKILAIGSYLKEHKGKESFSPEDIRPLFRTIGDIPPANFGRDFRVAVGNSWIAQEDKDPNSYYVTTIGFKALKANFAGGTIKKMKTRKRKKNEVVAGKNETEG